MAAGGAAIDVSQLPYIYRDWQPEGHWHFPSLGDIPGGLFRTPVGTQNQVLRLVLLRKEELILPNHYDDRRHPTEAQDGSEETTLPDRLALLSVDFSALPFYFYHGGHVPDVFQDHGSYGQQDGGG